jgi:hypothetical protein
LKTAEPPNYTCRFRLSKEMSGSLVFGLASFEYSSDVLVVSSGQRVAAAATRARDSRLKRNRWVSTGANGSIDFALPAMLRVVTTFLDSQGRSDRRE